MKTSKGVLPQENLFRGACALVVAGESQRAVTVPQAGDGRTLQLQWSVFDQWTEIDSWYEGHFMERIAPGAFKKTIAENRAGMRILLQHGRDPQLGEKPIASIDVLEENDLGGYAEGRLFDGLDPLVVEGLRSNQYGSSFRFGVVLDELNKSPEPSDYNPRGIPERTIKEARVSEFGPVTWGAYPEASAGVRSLTDEIHFGIFRDMPPEKLSELASFWKRGQRMDSEDVGYLAQMLTLATCYIEDQDEADDTGEYPNVVAMQAIQSSLIDLLAVEAQENEPDEPEDESNASTPSGTGRDDAPDAEGRGAVPVEGPAQVTPATDMYLSKRQRSAPWLLP